jgi:hypothetical protein
MNGNTSLQVLPGRGRFHENMRNKEPHSSVGGSPIRNAELHPVSNTTIFYQKKTGLSAVREDWWRLIIADDGEATVEHEWSQSNPYASRPPQGGKSTCTVQEFLGGQHDSIAKIELAKLIERAAPHDS